MTLYLGVTDNDWYTFLRQRENEDINFWKPGGKASFKAIQTGAPFLFKLKAPKNAIAGLGFFSSYSSLPINVAWDIFGVRNGAATYADFRQKIATYRSTANSLGQNSNIGCIVLTDPIFFREKDWIEVPANWSKSIVQGKSYNTSNPVGHALWQQVEATLTLYDLFERENSSKDLIFEEPVTGYGQSYLAKVRLGQGAFRVQLTDAYKRRCAISGEKTLPALDAAHIKPYAQLGPHRIANGLLLRADLHKLFDSGYVTVTLDYRVEVSGRIHEEFENGKDYYRHHGKPLALLPEKRVDLPGVQYLDWHNRNVYSG